MVLLAYQCHDIVIIVVNSDLQIRTGGRVALRFQRSKALSDHLVQEPLPFKY